MQNTFKVGDKVKVVKLTHPHCESLKKEIGKEFVVHTSSSRGVTNRNSDWFYNNEIELVKSIAWAVVDKSTGKVQWIRQPRSVARKLAKFQNETSTHVYQVKKIEFNFV